MFPVRLLFKAERFYDDWFGYLKEEGVDFLKVDNQLISERIARGQVPIMEVATGLHQNMRKACGASILIMS